MGGFINPNRGNTRTGADLGQWGGMGSAPGAGAGARTTGPIAGKPTITAGTGGIRQGPLEVTGNPQFTDPLGPKDPASMLAKGGGGGTSLMMSVDPATGRLPGELPPGTNQVGGVNKWSFAPTGAETAANPGQFAGTSFDPTRNIMQEAQGTPGGATSMGMQGAGITGQGIAGYTQGNGPLDRSRFTPGRNLAGDWYNQVFGKANPRNISYLGFADDLSRRALNSVGGYQAGNTGPDAWTVDGGITAQVNYLNSEEGQKWLESLTTDPNAQQTPNQQEAPVDPPPATTPPPANTPPPDPAKTKQQESSQASQIVNYLTQNGIQPRDIPIGIRLAALGVQGQNPLVNSGPNPIMQLLMSGGANNPLLAMLQGMK